MPYIDGESLRARLAREGRLPIEEAVELARSVADALSYAHGGEARIARAALAMAYSVSGRIAEARQIQTDLGDSPDTPRFQHAMIYAMIGDDEATFDWLERAFVARTDMNTLRAHPAVARMHAQPRFVRLLERLDLR